MMVQESCEIQAVLRTLLLSDLVNSTLLVERLGDRRAAELFARHDRLARDLLPEYGGVEIDKTDGFLMLFERPIDEVREELGVGEPPDYEQLRSMGAPALSA